MSSSFDPETMKLITQFEGYKFYWVPTADEEVLILVSYHIDSSRGCHIGDNRM